MAVTITNLNPIKNWKYMTKAQKVNFVVDVVCGFGGGMISVMIPNYGRNPVSRGIIGFTKFGLGMAIGSAAGKQIEEIVDPFLEEDDDE